MDRKTSKTPPLALVALFYFALTVFATYPLVFRLTSVSFRGLDSLLYVWNFWWVKHALLELGRNPLSCPILFWPAGTGLALHTLALPYGILSIPFQLALGDMRGAALAANAIVLCSFPLSGVGAFLLADYLVADRRAALVAGAVFVFFPMRFVELQLLHVCCTEWMPLTLLFLLKALREAKVRHAVGLGVCFAFQAYISLEHALYLALLLVLVVVYEFFGARTPLRRQHLVSAAVALGVVFVITAPLLAGMRGQGGGRGMNAKRAAFIRTAVNDSAPWFAFFRPNPLNPLWSPTEGTARSDMARYAPAFWDASLGSTTLLLIIVALRFFDRREMLFWTVVAALFLLLALGPYLKVDYHQATRVPMPFLFLWRHVPLFNMARAPSRILFVTMLVLSMLSAFGARHVIRAVGAPRFGVFGSRRRIGAAVLLSLFAWGESLIAPLPRGHFPVPTFCRTLASQPAAEGVIDLHPMRKVALFSQVVHHKPLVLWDNTAIAPRGGADGVRIARKMLLIRYLQDPSAFASLSLDRQSAVAVQAQRELSRNRIGYVVLHKRCFALRCQGHLGQLELSPRVVSQQDFVLRVCGLNRIWEDQETILFRFERPDGD